MRLNEILDPSNYRRGDELDTRSPYYDGRELDPSTEEYETTFTIYLYGADQNEIAAHIQGAVGITTFYNDYIPRGRGGVGGGSRGIEVEAIYIRSVSVDGHQMPVEQFLQQFGSQLDELHLEVAEEAIKGTGYKQLIHSEYAQQPGSDKKKIKFVPIGNKA